LKHLSPLPREFFNRDPRTVARELLGKLLVRRMDATVGRSSHEGAPCLPALGRRGTITPKEPSSTSRTGKDHLIAGRIVEAEAYCGATDPGSHAFNGETARNAVLFGPPGHAYIYFIYGNHYCTNVSCQPKGDGVGVLLRALEPVCGVQEMAALRGVALADPPRPAQLRSLTSGPGRLSQALGIERQYDNGKDLCSRVSDLFIADDGYTPAEIIATPRINVTRAPLDEWRYIIAGNVFVSGPRNANGAPFKPRRRA
jgi:DNA-3-methyladenine glycosylase